MQCMAVLLFHSVISLPMACIGLSKQKSISKCFRITTLSELVSLKLDALIFVFAFVVFFQFQFMAE